MDQLGAAEGAIAAHQSVAVAAVIDRLAIPRTAVGNYDKRALRERHRAPA